MRYNKRTISQSASKWSGATNILFVHCTDCCTFTARHYTNLIDGTGDQARHVFSASKRDLEGGAEGGRGLSRGKGRLADVVRPAKAEDALQYIKRQSASQ